MGGYGGGESLEGVDLGLTLLAFLPLHSWAEGILHRQIEVADLREAKVDGVEDADAEEGVHQEAVPKNPVELFDEP